ncbi:MAG: hypothetical protein IJ353_02220 [Lachnospiraceae bacterium]|nr:hypothetical protein [Lachnospiraceae bacterium]
MGVVIRFFRTMEKNWKMQGIFFCVSMLLLIIAYLGSLTLLRRQFEIIEDNYSWVYQVDSMEEQDGKLNIKGWIFALEQNAEFENYDIILYNEETGKKVFSKMSYISQKKVNDYFSCEYDYTDSGFVAQLSLNKLDDITYEVLIHPTNKKYAFSTGVFYSQGEMTFVDPDIFTTLDVEGTDLEEIVKDGVLRVCRPDVGMYVYQYEGTLYWIADETCEFVKQDRTYIDCMVETIQPDLLPENRNEFGFTNNLDFFFQNNEITDVSTNSYRVAKVSIPKEYPITSILTGYRENGEWVWKDTFRIYYELGD